MTTFLITGCAGLLGSRLTTWILDNIENSRIIGIDDLSGGFYENIDKRIRHETGKFDNMIKVEDRGKFYQIDLSEQSDILNNISADYVFHFAAYAAEALSPFVRKFNYKNNLITNANVINYCIKNNVKRLVFTSTMAVYGKNETPFHEDITPSPIDPYGIAKYAAEMDIKVAGQQHGLDWTIIRPHNVYGNGQNIWDPYRNVLGIWMWRKLNNKSFLVYGDGEQERAFSYINDSLPCLYRAAINPDCSNQIINLGGIKETTILEAAHILSDVVGGAEIEFTTARHEVKEAYSTFQKSIELLGFEHKVDLHDGLTNMWKWAKEQPPRDRKIWETYELDSGLYPFWKQDQLK